MNSNDLLAQQQALLNQIQQHQHQIVWGVVAIQILSLIVTVWVVYMFYCRLRDISVEIKHFRLAYESMNSPRANAPAVKHLEPPPASGSDTRYMPK